MYRSKKPVIELKELLGERIFTLPRSVANDIDTVTGKPCLFVGINGKPTYLPVETPTPISYPVFCVLKDLGLIGSISSFEEGGEL